jgi:hypothetical protein
MIGFEKRVRAKTAAMACFASAWICCTVAPGRTRSITVYGNLDGKAAGTADEEVMGRRPEIDLRHVALQNALVDDEVLNISLSPCNYLLRRGYP